MTTAHDNETEDETLARWQATETRCCDECADADEQERIANDIDTVLFPLLTFAADWECAPRSMVTLTGKPPSTGGCWGDERGGLKGWRNNTRTWWRWADWQRREDYDERTNTN